jgi:hypothetical protein
MDRGHHQAGMGGKIPSFHEVGNNAMKTGRCFRCGKPVVGQSGSICLRCEKNVAREAERKAKHQARRERLADMKRAAKP